MTFVPDVPYWLLIPLAVGMLGLCTWRFVVEPSRRIAWVRRTLLAVLVVAMVARPGVPGGEVPTGSVNVNVFLVIDTSQSIAAEDWADGQPRLEGIRQDVGDIAYAFAGANMSVITFDSQAQVRAPLTDDGSAVIELVNALNPEIGYYSHGTSISIARELLQAEIERADAADPGAPAVVIYMGDGEQTAADAPQPFDNVADLVDAGLVLGYGTEQGAPMLESTYDGTDPAYVQDPTTGEDAISRIDEQALQQIADEMGITYVHRDALTELAPTLTTMTSQQGEVDLTEYQEARLDLYWVLAVPLFLLLTWELWTFANAIAGMRIRRSRR